MSTKKSIFGQSNLLSDAQDRLQLDVLKSQIELCLPSDAPLIQRANHAINLLSPAETYWLNQKAWQSKEKAYILYHVDRERSKKQASNFLPLGKIALTACLGSMATAAQYKDHHTLASMLAIVTAATALSVAIDYTKNHVADNFEKKILDVLSQENDNIKTGMRCLTQRPGHSY